MLILFFLLMISHSLHGGDISSTGEINDYPPRAALFEPPDSEDIKRLGQAEKALQKDAEELKRQTRELMQKNERVDAPNPDDEWGFCTIQ